MLYLFISILKDFTAQVLKVSRTPGLFKVNISAITSKCVSNLVNSKATKSKMLYTLLARVHISQSISGQYGLYMTTDFSALSELFITRGTHLDKIFVTATLLVTTVHRDKSF